MKKNYTFSFGGIVSEVLIQDKIPALDAILKDMDQNDSGDKDGPNEKYGAAIHTFRAGTSPVVLLVCDENTLPIARKIAGTSSEDSPEEKPGVPICILKAGEEEKTWASAEKILAAAKEAGLGRDGIFIGVGGGVVSDLTAFAASIYMRGARLCLVSTTLLGMVDAAVGGKTGFDLFGAKNFAGSFFPAARIYLPIESLNSLPPREWKSGMAELIKTAVLEQDDAFFTLLESLNRNFPAGSFVPAFPADFSRQLLEKNPDTLIDCIARSTALKGRIVEADPRETGTERVLLNLGHTFAHALESTAGLGRLSHGEAVAWGMARSCELGLALGITPKKRVDAIIALLCSYGYETTAPHPLAGDMATFFKALTADKKKKGGKAVFIVPAERGACLISDAKGMDGGAESGLNIEESLLKHIVTGELRI
jgi:3-dehydroquinate synthase